MKTILTLGLTSLLSSCAHHAPSNRRSGSNAVYEDGAATPRIRQVTVVSELSLPADLKNLDVLNYEVLWVDPQMKADGEIELGHFGIKRIEGRP